MADVFQVGNGTPGNFDEGTYKVDIKVNGSSKGSTQSYAGENLGSFLKRVATSYGVKTFSAFADGRKLDTADAAKGLSGIKSIEIVAKDSRGRGRFIWNVDSL